MHTTLQTILQYGTLFGLIVGVLTLIVTARSYQRQVNAQILVEIAASYREMLHLIPPQAWINRLNTDQPLPESTPEVTGGFVRYLAIIVFAYFLHKKRYLSTDLWKLLQAEHQRTFTTPLFAREWNTIRHGFAYDPHFIDYVDSLQSASRNGGNTASQLRQSGGPRSLKA
jgi:hypothetical protein